MVIDFHTHIFPSPVARKATDNVGNYYSINMEGCGTDADLLGNLHKGPVTNALVSSSATTAKQVENVNTFIAEQVKKHNEFFGFGTLHPDYENVEKEIERIIELGLSGIKLHPDFQGFYADDDRMMEIYEMLEGKLPVLIHTGDKKTEFSKPQRIARIIDTFPKLTVIAAHMGGYSEWNLATEYLYGKNVYIDTSSALFAMDTKEMRERIYAHGVDRVVFGSDYPHRYPGTDYNIMLDCKLKDDEYQKIFCDNAKKILNL